MSGSVSIAYCEVSEEFKGAAHVAARDCRVYCDLLGVDPSSRETMAATVPFAAGDVTAGSENELQSAVIGCRNEVDLPAVIAASNYLKNIRKRAFSGETPSRLASDLERFLDDNREGVWENSWVRFPANVLNAFAERVFAEDLLEDKSCPKGPERQDAAKFTYRCGDKEFLRLPVSYVLKLSLAQALGEMPVSMAPVVSMGQDMMGHFLSDNTSPETFSFHPVRLDSRTGMGREIAAETAKRFLFCQILMQYANRRFQLQSHGQQALIYMAPNPPVRQKCLNDLISDSFYRELFMSPCLSGWDRGEDKHRYMGLCHSVLSRSQLNAVAKLREAGIIANNLVVLPNTSNVSLANNGTHISLGSRGLTQLMGDPKSGISHADEKFLGDLSVKVCEHFLPLFVGTYSAAPYRLDFMDFHPEKVLGFLPHELDFTHLRMIWRRWTKKAKFKVFGQPLTPFGPLWLDRMLQKMFRFSGDFIPDFRLVDYLVALKSTEESHALDGTVGNHTRLKRDLEDLGVFDSGMSLYMLYKLREFNVMGFSGFEGRYYSLFESFSDDMAKAAAMQALITAYAFQCILSGTIGHEDIPSDPFTESERRQVFFGTAIDIPTFYVHRESRNRMMLRLVKDSEKMRFSRRYSGYMRVRNISYRRALIALLRSDAAELIESMGLEAVISDLEERMEYPDKFSTTGKLTRGILETAGAGSPMELSGREFAQAAESYYGNELRRKHTAEALEFLAEDLDRIDGMAVLGREPYRRMLDILLEGEGAVDFLQRIRKGLMREEVDAPLLERLIALCILAVGINRDACGNN